VTTSLPASRQDGAGGLPEALSRHLDVLLATKQHGDVISHEELLDLVDEAELSTELVAALVARLEASGVSLEEHEEEADEAPRGSVPSLRPQSGRTSSGASDDPVQAYLTEIGHVALLDQQQEITLARTFHAGEAAAARVARHEAALSGDGPSDDKVSDRQVRNLKVTMRQGAAAQAQLIEANLRLVVSIAKRYRNRGVPFLDLIQEGNLGLMRAVEKFDPEKGFRFSTYATWWIRQSITRAVADQSRTIRIPVHLVEIINRVIATQRQMTQELGRDVTHEELAIQLDMTPEKVADLLHLNQDTISLEQPMGDDDFLLGDLIVDHAMASPDATASKHLLDDAIHEVLGQLDERERQVVKMRFGLDGTNAATLDEVGRAFGITRERVRQIEVKTIAKLRRPERSTSLRGFLESEE